MSSEGIHEDAQVEVTEGADDRIARIVLRGGEGNALDLTLVESLKNAIDALSKWPDLRAITLEGNGYDFSTGHPLAHLRPPFASALVEGFNECVTALMNLEALIISIVRGRCEGAGATLALAGDVVIADSTAKFSLLDATGHLPALTGILVTGKVDRLQAAKILLTDHPLTGEEALELRLISDYAAGWVGAGSLADGHINKLALPASRTSVADVVRLLRAPITAWIADSLPEAERRTVARLNRIEEGPARPKRWKPG